MYADLCCKLSQEVPDVDREELEGEGTSEGPEKIPFRTVLLERCQRDFYEDLGTRLAQFDDLAPVSLFLISGYHFTF